MPVPGWDVPGNYYDADVEEPEAEMTTPTYLDRLKAEVAFADAHGPKPDHAPVTDSSLTYGDLREMLAILSEIDRPLSDEETGMIDWAWDQHKAAGERSEETACQHDWFSPRLANRLPSGILKCRKCRMVKP